MNNVARSESRPGDAGRNRHAARLSFLAALGVLSLAVLGLALPAAGRIERAGLLRHNSWLFGFDTKRVIEDMTVPGSNQRSNIHPWFTLLVKPICRGAIRLGLEPARAAIWVNSLAGAVALLLFAAYGRIWGLARFEAALLAALLVFSAIGSLIITIPESYIFSIISLTLFFMLAIGPLRERPGPAPARLASIGREAGWIAAGTLVFGVTVTNGVQVFLAYWASHRGLRGFARAVVYGAVILLLGLAVSRAVNSYVGNWFRDENWLLTHKADENKLPHPILHSASAFLVFPINGPTKDLKVQPFGDQGDRIITYLEWRYDATGWILVLVWMGMLVFSAWAAWRDPDPFCRRLWAAFWACVGWNIFMHANYYAAWEGSFMFSGNALPALLSVLIPGLRRIGAAPAPWRLAGRCALAAFALALAVRHYQLLYALPSYFD
jgi:hypothetical protein